MTNLYFVIKTPNKDLHRITTRKFDSTPLTYIWCFCILSVQKEKIMTQKLC